MALVQLDLFGWNEAATQSVVLIQPTDDITVDDLANALIKHFGLWVSTHPNLLGDDWTVCETLVGIHHVFTRDQLKSVAQDVWTAAWQKFEAFYYTKRPRSGFSWEWPMH